MLLWEKGSAHSGPRPLPLAVMMMIDYYVGDDDDDDDDAGDASTIISL